MKKCSQKYKISEIATIKSVKNSGTIQQLDKYEMRKMNILYPWYYFFFKETKINRFYLLFVK